MAAVETPRCDAMPPVAPRPSPEEEHFRRRLLQALELPKTMPRLEPLCELAAMGLEAPVAAVTVVDADQVKILAEVHFGSAAPLLPPTRDESICAWGLCTDGVLTVPDIRLDDRFAGLPHVEAGVRAYHGAPVCLGYGRKVGMLCVLGFQPQEITPAQQALLVNLAQLVSCELMAGSESLSPVPELPPMIPEDLRPEQLMTPAWQFVQRLACSKQHAALVFDQHTGTVQYASQAWADVGPVPPSAWDLVPKPVAEWQTMRLLDRWAVLCPLDEPVDFCAGAALKGQEVMPLGRWCLALVQLPSLQLSGSLVDSSPPWPDVVLAAQARGGSVFLGLVQGRPCTVLRSKGESLPRRGARALRRDTVDGETWTLLAGAEGYDFPASVVAPRAC